ncbi:hypothetical protein HMPREF3190_00214 [Umbribacter vaginalis]|nr:hypothetical protein HMPREF3190_00214 [Coriobacteriales bacterium DNF00809]
MPPCYKKIRMCEYQPFSFQLLTCYIVENVENFMHDVRNG